MVIAQSMGARVWNCISSVIVMRKTKNSMFLLGLTKFRHCVRHLAYMDFPVEEEIDTHNDFYHNMLGTVMVIIAPVL